MFLLTAEEMREVDRRTIEDVGIPGVVLMENAGSQVVKVIKEKLVSPVDEVIVLAGHGNNGGDGFVISRHLGNNGFDVETWVIGDMKKLSKDSQINFHALVHSGYKVKFWSNENNSLLKERISQADIIIDAMLGTGITGQLREPYKGIISEVNTTNALKVAVDIPTGVNSNTGEVVDFAFRADVTVTFALPKIGQFIYPGADYVGELVVADISIPSTIVENSQFMHFLVTEALIREKLHVRSNNSHKGTFGHGLLVGGSLDMPGAPTLATMAALRSGAGLTTLAIPKSIKSMVFSRIPEAICLGLPETPSGHFTVESVEKLDTSKYTAMGIGPGIGIWKDSRNWLQAILKSNLPMVIDADGLNILAEDLSLLSEREKPTILTPHPGEMARLINKDIQEVQRNRISISKEFAQKHGIFLVLKGSNTIIASPDGRIYVNPTGGPELAKGGSGDVLTGMIVGFLAQRKPTIDALLLAVYLHGLAGSLASNPSNYSTLASEVVDNIGFAIHHTMSNHA